MNARAVPRAFDGSRASRHPPRVRWASLHLPRSFALLALVASALASGCDRAAAPDGPALNLLLIVADDLGRSDVGFLDGTLETPGMDRIAAEGVVLDRFYAHPACSLTRAALLTGQSPATLGLFSVIRPWEDRGLDPSTETLAELLRANGYATALVGKWHLGHARRAHWPQQHGFDHFYGSLLGSGDYFTRERHGARDWQRNGEPLDEEGYSTDLVSDEAVRWLRAVGDDRPFLLMVAYQAPHPPRQAPRERLASFAALPRGEAVYAAMVAALDDGVAQLLDELDKSGRAENTLVVLLSDNGAGNERRTGGLRGDKGSVYEGGLRAPAVMRLSGALPAATRSEQRLTAEDLFATLLAGLGVGYSASVDGQDMWQQLASGTTRERGTLFFAVDGHEGRSRAVLQGRFKRVERLDRSTGEWRGEAFDVEEDPGETNAITTPDDGASGLADELERWHASSAPADALPTRPPKGWQPPSDWVSGAAAGQR